MIHSRICPHLSPFGSRFGPSFCVFPSSFAYFEVPKMVQKKRDEHRTGGQDERTDAHRIFEALLHKSPFGAKKFLCSAVLKNSSNSEGIHISAQIF